MALQISWRVFSLLRQQQQQQLCTSLLSRRLPAGRARRSLDLQYRRAASSETGNDDHIKVPWAELEENLKKLGPSSPPDPRDMVSNKFTGPIHRRGTTGSVNQGSGNDAAVDSQLPIIHVRATYNNTMFTITDHTGRVLAWTSCGVEGFKNSRKGTTFAAQSAGMAAAKKAINLGYNRVDVKLKGPGPGRQSALKGLEMGAVRVASIQDVTPIPHNGCRPRKNKRR